MSTQTDLERHEAVCEERYLRINGRLDNLDKQFDVVNKKIDDFKSDIYKLLIGSAVSVILALLSAAITLIVHIK